MLGCCYTLSWLFAYGLHDNNDTTGCRIQANYPSRPLHIGDNLRQGFLGPAQELALTTEKQSLNPISPWQRFLRSLRQSKGLFHCSQGSNLPLLFGCHPLTSFHF